MISTKDLKARIQRSRWSRSHAIPHSTKGFNLRYQTKSDTEQLKLTLAGASTRSKAPISLPPMPWDDPPAQ